MTQGSTYFFYQVSTNQAIGKNSAILKGADMLHITTYILLYT
jgi:hypothetical protein